MLEYRPPPDPNSPNTVHPVRIPHTKGSVQQAQWFCEIYNTALGHSALLENTSGHSNAAMGYRSLGLNTTGARNTAVGDSSLSINTTGFNNTGVGGKNKLLTLPDVAPGDYVQDLEALLQNIRVQAHSTLEQIALPTVEGFSMVHVNTISYLQTDSNYTWVFLADKRKYLVAKTLKESEGMLAFPQYFRPHKSYVVNLNHVDRYVRGQGGYLVMREGVQVPVARAMKAGLLKTLKI